MKPKQNFFWLTRLLSLALLTVILAVDAAAGKKPASANSGIQSGIQGVAQIVVTGGAQPGPGMPPKPPPTPVAYPGVIVSFQPVGGGGEIARSVADREGRFQQALPTGNYRVISWLPGSAPSVPSPISAPAPQTVTVKPKQFVGIVITFIGHAP